jgi:AcrR family transcriptional regulator
MNLDSPADSRVSLRAQFRHATREAILEAAAESLGEASGSTVRVEDIAARAGVAVGTVYNYFEDRRALMNALLESRTQALTDALDAAMHEPAPAPGRRTGRARAAGARAQAGQVPAAFEAELSHFVSAVAAHFDANRFLISALSEEERVRGVDARVATRRLTVRGDLLARAERLMARGIRSRALRKGDPALYAALLVGMFKGVALNALSRQGTFAADGAGAIVEMFMRGAGR